MVGLFDTRFGSALMAVASAALAGILTIDIAFAIRELDQKFVREHSARAVAESESRVKDDVLSLLTQGLRTPANVIHAQAHLLQAGVLTQDRMRQVIDVVSRNAARLRQYVDDAAEVATMAQGGVLLEPKEIDPREPIRHAMDRWKTQIAAKEIRLSSELIPVGLVQGDEARLQQLFSNLLSNAVIFTPKGGEIRVETARDGDRLRVSTSSSRSVGRPRPRRRIHTALGWAWRSCVTWPSCTKERSRHTAMDQGEVRALSCTSRASNGRRNPRTTPGQAPSDACRAW